MSSSQRLLSWTDDAWDDYLYWQTQDKKTLKRINKLINDVKRSPFEGIGKPEPLKENLSGFWSSSSYSGRQGFSGAPNRKKYRMKA